jgi:spore germination cell wall hydrolase CwlJ-like protein
MKDRTDPTNRDTVPAMLTPGEFVVNKEATQMYADQLKAMNNNGLALRAKRNGIPGFNEGGIALSDKDKDLLIRMAAAEARGEDPEGQAAVMYVVLNRQKANREEFSGDKIKDIIYHPNAFTSTVDENKGYYKLNDTDIPKSAEYKKAKGILNDILSGKMKDPTGGAEHFLNPDNLDEYPKWWREGTHNRKQIGRHVFALNNKIHNLKTPPPKVRKIPGYNNGGMPMEDDDIMNFIMNYQGKLGDVNPEDVAAGVISDEDLLQNSSDVGANSFMQANEMQYGDPRQSIPMPGAFMGNITDAQSLRAGVVRPDMMPPGYVPPKVTPKQSYKPMPYMDITNPVNRNMYPEAEGYGLNNQMPIPPGPDVKPFFDTSLAYDADGNEIIGNVEDGLVIPPTMNQFARQNIEAQLTLAEKSKLEGERILKNAGTERQRLKAIAMIEKANSDIERYNVILNKDNENYTTVSNVEDRNDLRNSELKLAQLRKERAKYSTDGNPLHLAQLDESIAAEEISINEKKKALNIDDKTTDDKEIKNKTEVLTSRVPIPRNLEEAAQSGEVEKAGSKVKQDSPQWESAKNFLKDIFGDIFNKKDLVRAITIYLGARIFGASGNQAGAMAGKYYLGKQDAHEATIAAYAKSGKYTPDSVALYGKTRNLADLVAIGKPVTPTGDFKMYYGVTKDGNTIRVNAQKFRLGEGSYVWKRKTKDGWVSFDVENYTADGSSNPNFDRDAYEQRFDRLYDQAKDLAEGNLTYIDENDKEQKYFENLSEADIAQDLAKWAIDNDVDIGTAGDALKMAINMAKQAERKTGNTSDLTDFLNQTYIVAETNPSGESAVAFKNLEGEYIPYGLLKDAITNVSTIASKNNPNIANMNPVLRNTAIIKFANREYREYAKARAIDGAPDIYVDAAKNNKTTPVYEFMRAYR